MKKIVRTIWISALSGLAFLGACCTNKGLTRSERKQLMRERDSIQEILKGREGAVIYGTPEIMQARKLKDLELKSRLDTINYQLGEDVDLEISARRVELQRRLNELQTTLRNREGACIYGTPEVMERYKEETNRMKKEAESIRKELQNLDMLEGSQVNDGKVEALYGVPMP
ncbi:MAG: hypothetical protein IKG95_06290 [Bacteroidales bacterium]|nr:hypothetical protein [Bacteroidales bacterium]MBR3427531.1 hypothetical protein [Bacteroidales bacterium]